MKNYKIIIIIFVIIFIIISTFGYPSISHIIRKYTLDDISIINYYSSKQFSSNTEVQSIEFIKEENDKNDEFLKAVLFVPTEEINNIFTYEHRIYTNDKNIDFSYTSMTSVYGVFTHTQRSEYFTVLKPQNRYSQVNIFIDKLCWNKKKIF